MKKCWLELEDDNSLDDLPADATPDFDGDSDDARKATDDLRDELISLQDRLHAQGRHALLIVFQAMDTGGKDSTIRRVFSGVNPAGIRMARFASPSNNELAHDYLWRVHPQTPARGQIVIFNRSHYEDVLVVRTNKLFPEPVWRRRYEHIRGFERMLSDEGTTILKFYLHIDREEQRERLQDRLDEPDKHWKFQPHDIEQRKLWNDYMAAYADAIRETSRPFAPWYIIPANRKWYRDYAVMSIIVDTVRRLDPQYPEPDFDPKKIKLE